MSELLAGAVGGVLVLLVQYILRVRGAQAEHTQRASWNRKLEVYTRALNVVNRLFLARDRGESACHPEPAAAVFLTDPPSTEEVNEVHAELLVWAPPGIVEAFVEIAVGAIRVQYRTRMVQLIREDLGMQKLNIDPDKDLFFLTTG